VQLSKAPPSSEHAKLEPVSDELNSNVASAPAVDADRMVVTGGVVSGGGAIVHVAVAGDPTFPASSRARTANEWTPGARPLYAAGLEHGKNAPRSRLHRNVEPLSLARKVKEASPLVVFCGGLFSLLEVCFEGNGDQPQLFNQAVDVAEALAS